MFQPNKQRPQHEFPGLAQALQDMLLDTDTSACLPLEQMVDYAQEALAPTDRAMLQAHVNECPLCAVTIADLRRAYRPVLRLHRGLAGWLGALLAYLHWLPARLRPRWQEHIAPCARCRGRVERLQSVLSPSVTLAVGAACTALALFTLGRPPGRVPAIDTPGAYPVETSKGGNIARIVPGTPVWPTSAAILEGYLYPTQNQAEIEKYWRTILERHPDSIAAHETLARIYRQHAATAIDPRRKAGWQERAEMEQEQMRQLIK